jgi:hypothetical protein
MHNGIVGEEEEEEAALDGLIWNGLFRQEEAVCAARWDQCGGAGWKGLTCCEDSSDCDAIGPYYAHCVPRS